MLFGLQSHFLPFWRKVCAETNLKSQFNNLVKQLFLWVEKAMMLLTCTRFEPSYIKFHENPGSWSSTFSQNASPLSLINSVVSFS